MTWKGVILEESLQNNYILNLAKIIGTDIDKLEEENRIMTFHKVTIEDSIIEKYIVNAMHSLKPSFYTHICKNNEMYVIYNGVIFNFKEGEPEKINKARNYGLEMGILEEQMPFEHLINNPFD